jgi:transcriptional regulator with XRE-family HTH domain
MSEMNDEVLIERLKYLIALSGLKLTEVAEEIGVPYRTLQNQFRGESKMPALTLVKILDVLKLTSGHLKKNPEPIDTDILRKALVRVLGDHLPRFEITDDKSILHPAEEGLKARDEDEVRRASSILAGQIERAYLHVELEGTANRIKMRSVQNEPGSQ